MFKFATLKSKVVAGIHALPYAPLIFMSIWMLLAPIFPEPHLVQKASWLMNFQPFRAIDVLDVIWHTFPSAVLLVKWRTHV